MKQQKQIVDSSQTYIINTADKYEVEDWARKFKVSPDGLYNAIKRVGANVKELEKFYATRKKL